MNIQQLVFVLRARARVILGCVLAALALGMLWIFASPLMYRATSQVVVSVRSPEGVGDNAEIQSLLAPDYLSTQADIIRSTRVARRAVEILGVAKDAEAVKTFNASGTSGAPEDYFAQTLQRGLVVNAANTTRVITISYASPSPRQAAKASNAIAAAYQDVSLALQIEPARRSLAWYDRSADAVRQQLADARQQLVARQQALSITADTDEGDPEIARLTALSQALASAQAQQSATTSRAGSGAQPDALISPVVQQLQTELARLEAQRQQLGTRVGPNNDEMREIQGQISVLRQSLQRQRSEVQQSARAASSQAMSNVSDLSRQLATQKDRVLASRSARGDVAELQQRVSTLEKTYEDLVARRSRAAVAGAGEQTNVTLLSQAVPPTSPAGLPRLMKLALMLILGTAAGVGLALLIEFLDQRIHGADDLLLRVGIPSFGTVRVFAEPTSKLLMQPRRYLPPRLGSTGS